MSTYNASTLSDLGVDRFLHAEIGTELNGSNLTVLSLFARLGKDPWAEAARLSHLSRASMVECMAENIAAMPLGAEAIADARGIAVRLSSLLPGTVSRATSVAPAPARSGAMKWAPLATVFVVLALGIAFNTIALMGGRDAAVTPMADHAAAPGR